MKQTALEGTASKWQSRDSNQSPPLRPLYLAMLERGVCDRPGASFTPRITGITNTRLQRGEQRKHEVPCAQPCGCSAEEQGFSPGPAAPSQAFCITRQPSVASPPTSRAQKQQHRMTVMRPFSFVCFFFFVFFKYRAPRGNSLLAQVFV